MKNLLIVLATAATTAFAQGKSRNDNDCLWQCRDEDCWRIIKAKNDWCPRQERIEFCFDTCTPELSKCEFVEGSRQGQQCGDLFYDSEFWAAGLQEFVQETSEKNNSPQVYQYFNDYHEQDNSQEYCSPEWECEWEECAEDELNENGDVCWKELCTNECEEELCKVWHAYEYDYDNAEWLWDIQECPKDLADQVVNFEAFAQEQVENGNLDSAIDLAVENVPDEFVAWGFSGEMFGEVAASYVDDLDIDVAGALDTFYADENAVGLANTVAQEATEEGFDASNLEGLINARNGTLVEEVATQVLNEQSQVAAEQAQKSTDEESSWLTDFFGAFVTGYSNNNNERKGARGNR